MSESFIENVRPSHVLCAFDIHFTLGEIPRRPFCGVLPHQSEQTLINRNDIVKYWSCSSTVKELSRGHIMDHFGLGGNPLSRMITV